MAISLIFIEVYLLFVPAYAWLDYVDYYDYISPNNVQVSIGSEVTLRCYAEDNNLFWEHDRRVYHSGVNYSNLKWLSNEPGDVNVTILSEEDTGTWNCFGDDSLNASYELLLIPDDTNQTSTKNTTVTSAESSTVTQSFTTQRSTTTKSSTTTKRSTTTDTISNSLEFYSITTSKNVKMQSEEVENELIGNVFNVLFDSLRNPFVRARKTVITAGAGSLSSSIIVVVGIFIVNILNV